METLVSQRPREILKSKNKEVSKRRNKQDVSANWGSKDRNPHTSAPKETEEARIEILERQRPRILPIERRRERRRAVSPPFANLPLTQRAVVGK
jgi:hypothetical protein